MGSGRQALTGPVGPLQAEVQAVVQTTRAALPELDALRQQAVTTPVFGAIRLGIAEALFGGLEQRLQLFAVPDYPALR